MTTSETEERLTKDDIRLLFTLLDQAEESITENETDDKKETSDRVRIRIRRIRRILARILGDKEE